MPRAVLQESWKVTLYLSLRLGSSLSLLLWIRSAVNSQMCTIFVLFACSKTVPVTGDLGTSRWLAGPFIVSMYWCTTRHMWPHSPPRIHFTPRRLDSAYILALSRFIISFDVKSPKLPPSELYAEKV